MVKDIYKKYLEIQAYEESGILKKNVNFFDCILIHTADYYSKKDELVKFQLYQVYSDKKINNLTIETYDKFFKQTFKA